MIEQSDNNVSHIRDEVKLALPSWRKVRDCVDGERAVKAAKETYLPKPNPTDLSPENAARYKQYVFRASFLGATARTKNGLIGIAFGEDPVIEIPDSMDYVKTDINGSGGGIFNQAHQTLGDVLEVGRHGLLTDYPSRDRPASRAEQVAQNLHPVILSYAPETIINWRLDGSNNLSLVVLYEAIEEPYEYETCIVDQWRELYMEEGVYKVRIWRSPTPKKGDIKTGAPELLDEFIPLKADGSTWNKIPFSFVGSNDNNAGVDKSPLLDIADKNITHYQASADYFESVHWVGQPTYVFTGLSPAWVDDVWRGEVLVGSRAGMPLPKDADAKILEASPNTLAGEAMVKLENEMVALGAYLLTPGTVAKTAEQSRSDTAAAHSVLSLSADNVSAAYTRNLKWCAEFSGDDPDDVQYMINTDFLGLMTDPNLINATVSAWQADAIPTSDKNTTMKKLGFIDPLKTDEEIEGEIEANPPTLNLDDPTIDA